MTQQKSRIKAVKSVRRRDRAEAFNALRKALAELAAVQSELDEAGRRIDSIRNELTSASTPGTIPASRLQMNSLNRERLSVDLIELDKTKKALEDRIRKLRMDADAAKDGAANAHRAYAALDGDRDK